MNLLSNIRISHKISALMVGLVLGFVIIGVAYYVQINQESNAKTEQQRLKSSLVQLSEIKALHAKSKELTSQAYYFHDGEEISGINKSLEKIQAILSDLSTDATPLEIKKKQELINSFDEYQKVIEAANLSLLTLLGSESEAGVFPAWDTSTHSLEQLIARYRLEDVMLNYRQMNQYEIGMQTFNPDAYNNAKSQMQVLVTAIDESKASASQKDKIKGLLNDHQQVIDNMADALSHLTTATTLLEDMSADITMQLTSIESDKQTAFDQHVAKTEYNSRVMDAFFTATLFLVAISAAVGMYLIYKSIVLPMAHMQRTISRLRKGETEARVGLKTNDELGDLGRAFNNLLDERIQYLEDQSRENEHLNNSIIGLIKSVGMIAKKDLTVKVPVSEDITGTVSDAVNLLTSETAKTLSQVREVSEQVNAISDILQEQAGTVSRVAEDERNQVNETCRALDFSAKAMNTIAQEAEAANELANNTIKNTKDAFETVTQTVEGIIGIRDSISETEKRIKRLGERSQEITGIVNLINTIAERTHILALNASMHAASAGEAGKGFAVVAEEVQRLAENAREATSNISSMVNNIRVETSDTVETMNKLITQVAEGTRLAERAGQSMNETEESTRTLVETVKNISENSSNQAKFSNKVRDRALTIRRYSEQTGRKLEEQREYTDNLKEYSKTLVDRVSIFTLPEDKVGKTKGDVVILPTASDTDSDNVTAQTS